MSDRQCCRRHYTWCAPRSRHNRCRIRISSKLRHTARHRIPIVRPRASVRATFGAATSRRIACSTRATVVTIGATRAHEVKCARLSVIAFPIACPSARVCAAASSSDSVSRNWLRGRISRGGGRLPRRQPRRQRHRRQNWRHSRHGDRHCRRHWRRHWRRVGPEDGGVEGAGVGVVVGISERRVGEVEGAGVGVVVGISVGAGVGVNVSTSTESAWALDMLSRRRYTRSAPSSPSRRRLAGI